MNERAQLAVGLVALAGLGAVVFAFDRRAAAGDALAPDWWPDASGEPLPAAPAFEGWPLDYSTADAAPDVPADVPSDVPADVPDAQPSDAGVFASTANVLLDSADSLLMKVGLNTSRWLTVAQKPENAQYLAWAQAAEVRYGLPPNTLVRLIYQECRFRADIISGATVSSAGAVGIMQLVPRWHPTVDPLDARAAIDYAAAFLARLYRKFGTWELALQAYNWGEGNLQKYLDGKVSTLPRETRNYSSMILADVSAANGVVIS